MSWTITLGTLIDAMLAQPSTRSAIYEQAKCRIADPCRSCSTQFARTWRLARRLGLIVRSGGKFMLRDWNEGAAGTLGIWL
jgi:hypothetical protein